MVKVNRKEAEPMKEGYVDNRFASLYYRKWDRVCLSSLCSTAMVRATKYLPGCLSS